MGVPSFFVVAILVVCFFNVRPGPRDAPVKGAPTARAPLGPVLLALFVRPLFLVTCALSFMLTLIRDSFNVWSVDFLLSIQGGTPSMMTAGLQSTGFDLAGGISILAAGFAYDRVRPELRRWMIAGCLALLAVVIAVLPPVAAVSTAGAAALVGLVGLLVYGPYSLLAGVLAIESGGKEAAATAAGLIDGVGYVGSALAGSALGKLLDLGGYTLGFRVLAGVTVVSAVLALGLRPPPVRTG
jgi:sugar phosphate permease